MFKYSSGSRAQMMLVAFQHDHVTECLVPKTKTKIKTETARPRPRPALVWDRSCHKTTVSDYNTDGHMISKNGWRHWLQTWWEDSPIKIYRKVIWWWQLVTVNKHISVCCTHQSMYIGKKNCTGILRTSAFASFSGEELVVESVVKAASWLLGFGSKLT